MFIQLAEHSAELEMAFAKISEFKQFRGNIEFSRCFVEWRSLRSCRRGEHLLHESFIFIKICNLAFKIENCSVEIACTILKE